MSETIRKRKSYTIDEKVAAIAKLKELNVNLT
jgi:hypothetical protein